MAAQKELKVTLVPGLMDKMGQETLTVDQYVSFIESIVNANTTHLIPFADTPGSDKATLDFEISVLQKLKASVKVGARVASGPILIVGPYVNSVEHTINRLEKDDRYKANLDIIAAQAMSGQGFNKKKLEKLNKLAAGKPIGVSSLSDWELVAKAANPYKGPKDPKTGKDTAKVVKK